MHATRHLLRMRPLGLAALIVAGIAIADPVAASEWRLVAERSTVTMYAVKQGATFSGVFEAFEAEIDFDPAHPERGRIAGTVATGSIDTRDEQNDRYVLSYLETEKFPEARFTSTSIVSIPGGFRALGALTLKGITRDVALDFAFEAPGDAASSDARASLRGSLSLNRFDFDIASDVDLSFAGQDVYVQIVLSLER